MEDVEISRAGFEVYFYVAIVVISWIIGAIRKMNKQTPKQPSKPYTPSTNPRKQDDLPDIFKDLFEERKTVVQEQRSSQPVKEIKRPEKKVEEVVIDDRFAAYSGNVTQSQPEEVTPKKRFEHYRIKKEKTNKYKKALQSPAGIKQAVIASEILKRKF